MKLILCVEENGGMAFHNRRVSKDRVQLENMMEEIKETPFYVSPYSAKMLEEYGFCGYVETTEPDQIAEEDAWYFCEFGEYEVLLPKVTEILLYQWNRRYPSNVAFDMQLLEDYEKTEETEFQGSSHDKITKIRYCKKES